MTKIILPPSPLAPGPVDVSHFDKILRSPNNPDNYQKRNNWLTAHKTGFYFHLHFLADQFEDISIKSQNEILNSFAIILIMVKVSYFIINFFINIF